MSSFLQFCIGLVMIVIGSGYGYGLWVDRKNANKIDTVKLFKDQIDGMELKMKQQELDIVKLTGLVQDLKLAIDSRDKKFAEVILSLEGKDPIMMEFIKTNNDYMQMTTPILNRMEQYLNKQSF